MNSGPTKILVVDDSALYRQSILNVLRENADALVVGTAKNGIEAIEKVAQLEPDLLTLDVQMPDMDGIEVLREIKRRRLSAQAIMVSSLTSEGANVTTDALLEGAFDFILKPLSSDSQANRQQLRDALEEKIAMFREAMASRRGRTRRPVANRSVAAHGVVELAPAPEVSCQAVIIGASTGGPEALKIVLPRLSADLPVPVFVVQHMPAKFTSSLAARLDEICQLQVVEATDKAIAAPGSVIIAAGGKQMKLERTGANLLVRVNDDPPENAIRPSVDYLIRSACDVLAGNALVVILTGMGRDGLSGCSQLKPIGGYVFAQHQDDSVVFGMPKAVIEANLADRTLPLGKIAPAIARHLRRSRRS